MKNLAICLKKINRITIITNIFFILCLITFIRCFRALSFLFEISSHQSFIIIDLHYGLILTIGLILINIKDFCFKEKYIKIINFIIIVFLGITWLSLMSSLLYKTAILYKI